MVGKEQKETGIKSAHDVGSRGAGVNGSEAKSASTAERDLWILQAQAAFGRAFLEYENALKFPCKSGADPRFCRRHFSSGG